MENSVCKIPWNQRNSIILVDEFNVNLTIDYQIRSFYISSDQHVKYGQPNYMIMDIGYWLKVKKKMRLTRFTIQGNNSPKLILIHWPDAGLWFGQSCRWWSDFKPACIVRDHIIRNIVTKYTQNTFYSPVKNCGWLRQGWNKKKIFNI